MSFAPAISVHVVPSGDRCHWCEILQAIDSPVSRRDVVDPTHTTEGVAVAAPPVGVPVQLGGVTVIFFDAMQELPPNAYSNVAIPALRPVTTPEKGLTVATIVGVIVK